MADVPADTSGATVSATSFLEGFQRKRFLGKDVIL